MGGRPWSASMRWTEAGARRHGTGPNHGQPRDGDGDATAYTQGARVNLPGPRLDQGSGALPSCDPP